MKLLAIETATEACSAAILIDDDVVERYEVAPRKHNELILSMCEDVMSQAGLSLSQLDGIGFGCGPGAFTGVRIAASVTQGIAFAHDLPVAAISTLENLSYQADVSIGDYILPAIDARMDEIYWAVYKKVDHKQVVLERLEQVLAPSLISELGVSISYGLGSGWKTYHSVLLETVGLELNKIEGDALPCAKVCALLAQQKYLNNEMVKAEDALPVYLRNNVVHQKS